MKTTLLTPRKERGQSLVELAVSLTVLLMLLTGAVETSLALFQYVTIRDAAQEGATYGSINPTDVDGIKWRAIDAASDVVALVEDDIDVTYNGASCEGQTGGSPNSINVVIDFDHPITFPFVTAMTGQANIHLQASVTNTILNPVCP